MKKALFALCVAVLVLIGLTFQGFGLSAKVAASGQEDSHPNRGKNDLCGTYFLNGSPDTYMIIREDGTLLYVDGEKFGKPADGRIPVLVGTWAMIDDNTLLVVTTQKEGVGIGRELEVSEGELISAGEGSWLKLEKIRSRVSTDFLLGVVRDYYRAVVEGDYLGAKNCIKPSLQKYFTTDFFEEERRRLTMAGDIKNLYFERKGKIIDRVANGEYRVNIRVEFESGYEETCWLYSEDGVKWKLQTFTILSEEVIEKALRPLRERKLLPLPSSEEAQQPPKAPLRVPSDEDNP